MKVLNYGSLNVDYVYSVDHIIVGGETQHSSKLEVFSGGKGLNQSIALAKAGVPVYHAGIVGTDGDILLEACKEAGVNTKYIRRLPVKGGHTMIQVDKNAQNCIILYGGTNQMQTKEFVDEVLADFGEGDYLILQNEINMLDYIIDQGQTEAGRSLGLNFSQTMRLIIIPQAFKNVLPALVNEFIVLIKETSIIGYIGMMDLTKGAMLIQSRTYNAFWPLMAAAAIYLVIVGILTWGMNKLERRLRTSER